MPATDELTKTQKYRIRNKRLRDDSGSWMTHWRDLAKYLLPRKGRYLSGEEDQKNAGAKKHQAIINGSANDALRIVAAGMQGGLTSPARPWFVLTLGDAELMEFAPVRIWLGAVRDAMLGVFAQSNFYGSIHGQYKELADER